MWGLSISLTFKVVARKDKVVTTRVSRVAGEAILVLCLVNGLTVDESPIPNRQLRRTSLNS
jgi:hypothetical protein